MDITLAPMAASGGFPQEYLSLALIDASLTIAVADAQQWLKPSEHSQVVFEIPTMRPHAYEPKHTYGYFWSPLGKPECTALVANTSIAYNLAHRFKHRVLEIRVSPTNDEWPICELQLTEGGKERRFVRAFRDDTRWDFYEKGEPLPFENISNYKKRRIRDRFTPEMVFEYCLALGWNIEPTALLASSEPAAQLIHQWVKETPVPCPFCGEFLKSPRAKQCLHCGTDWHNVG